jgi:hypothetical protein
MLAAKRLFRDSLVTRPTAMRVSLMRVFANARKLSELRDFHARVLHCSNARQEIPKAYQWGRIGPVRRG